MDENTLNELISVRTNLINYFTTLKDYRKNKNAIMREFECAEIIHKTIVEIDSILKKHVEFADTK